MTNEQLDLLHFHFASLGLKDWEDIANFLEVKTETIRLIFEEQGDVSIDTAQLIADKLDLSSDQIIQLFML